MADDFVEDCSDHFTNILEMDNDKQKSVMEFSGIHDHEFASSFFEWSISSSDELEELYKPFHPGMQPLQEIQPVNDVQYKHDNNESDSCVTKATHDQDYTSKYKKRKNQQKRVTIQVSSDGLGSDMWAWRKYGQKPIKGSPYPRSYYRCSSSKDCLARKQVEKSCADSGMLIITYIAEHNHSQPTRRNSLAGTIRHKFPTPNHHHADTNTLLHVSSDTHNIIKHEDDDDDDDYNEFAMSDSFFSGGVLNFCDGFLS